MASLTARDGGSATMTAQVQVPSTGEGTDLLVRQACLVAEYLSYMAAAGYSIDPGATAERSLGAWSFLELPVTEQMRLPSRERGFVHYLFLRHVMPMPPTYALMSGAHLGDMARRHLERESYGRYHNAAFRLGYTEATVRRQFEILLCLMAWARKPMTALAAADLDQFTDVLAAVRLSLEEKGGALSPQDAGLAEDHPAAGLKPPRMGCLAPSAGLYRPFARCSTSLAFSPNPSPSTADRRPSPSAGRASQMTLPAPYSATWDNWP